MKEKETPRKICPFEKIWNTESALCYNVYDGCNEVIAVLKSSRRDEKANERIRLAEIREIKQRVVEAGTRNWRAIIRCV